MSSQQLTSASIDLAARARQVEILQAAKKVLSYLPTGGEISPECITQDLPEAEIFLPRIVDFNACTMQFFAADNAREKNRFGIEEPLAEGPSCTAEALDVALVPLVAFDDRGHRIGMGGGYYDRAFAAKLESRSAKPVLIGVAHHFQQVQHVMNEAWDVPLDVIITDQDIFDFRASIAR